MPVTASKRSATKAKAAAALGCSSYMYRPNKAVDTQKEVCKDCCLLQPQGPSGVEQRKWWPITVPGEGLDMTLEAFPNSTQRKSRAFSGACLDVPHGAPS